MTGGHGSGSRAAAAHPRGQPVEPGRESDPGHLSALMGWLSGAVPVSSCKTSSCAPRRRKVIHRRYSYAKRMGASGPSPERQIPSREAQMADSGRSLGHRPGHRAICTVVGPHSGPYRSRCYPRVRRADRPRRVGTTIKAASGHLTKRKKSYAKARPALGTTTVT